jgi:hypothetical protein
VTAAGPRSGADIAISIALLVGALLLFLVGAVVALFLDAGYGSSCNDGDCSGTIALFTGFGLLVALVLGTIGTIVLIAIRRRGWWVAAPTLGVVVVGWVVAIALEALGVG